MEEKGITMKKIGLIDADLLDNGTRHPNLALMKIAGYYKDNGYDAVLIKSYNDVKGYKEIFISKVFTFTQVPQEILDMNNIHIGGTGFFFDGGEDSIALLKAMIESIKSVALSIQIYTSFDYGSRTTAASDELDSLSESLAEMIEQIDSNLLWIERKGKNAELVYCPKNTSQITNQIGRASCRERV